MSSRLLHNCCLAATLILSSLPQALAKDKYLFVYFKEPGNDGVYYALSDDAYHWKAIHNDKPSVPTTVPGEVMRDVFVTRGPDHEFHMVWTWAWKGQSIGYAHSPDLIHWSEQRQIPLMVDIPGARNTWAPEIYWDEKQSAWMIIWSSTVEGKQAGNRIYYSMTRDFQTFTKPAIFFDPGYVVIDATILKDSSKYILVFKDETQDPLRRQLRYATGPTLQGPWSGIGAPFTESWSEGASVMKVGDEYVVYYDHYRPPRRYEANKTKDWKTWESISDQVEFPPYCKHGSFLKITEEEAARLLSSQ